MDMIARAKELRGQNMPISKIAKTLNQEGYKTVKGLPFSTHTAQYYAVLKHKNEKPETKTGRSRDNLAAALDRINSLGLSTSNRLKVISIILDDFIAQ